MVDIRCDSLEGLSHNVRQNSHSRGAAVSPSAAHSHSNVPRRPASASSAGSMPASGSASSADESAGESVRTCITSPAESSEHDGQEGSRSDRSVEEQRGPGPPATATLAVPGVDMGRLDLGGTSDGSGDAASSVYPRQMSPSSTATGSTAPPMPLVPGRIALGPLNMLLVYETLAGTSDPSMDAASSAYGGSSSAGSAAARSNGSSDPLAGDIGRLDLAGWSDGSAEATSSAYAGNTSGSSGVSGGSLEPPVPLIPEHIAYGPLNLLLDGETLGVLGCTVGVMALTGPLVYKSNFENLVVNAGQFHTWMQCSVNHQLSQCEEYLQPFQLTVAPQMARKCGNFEFHVTATLIETELQIRPSDMGVDFPFGFEDGEHDVLCMIELSNLELHWRGPLSHSYMRSRQIPRPTRQNHNVDRLTV